MKPFSNQSFHAGKREDINASAGSRFVQPRGARFVVPRRRVRLVEWQQKERSAARIRVGLGRSAKKRGKKESKSGASGEQGRRTQPSLPSKNPTQSKSNHPKRAEGGGDFGSARVPAGERERGRDKESTTRRRPPMRKFQESVKALEADIEHANAL